ncbi:MAG: Maf family protein [Sphaerochaetaceae bacterium]|nr:Maf family protein [Sphaerochaetaceae bacterium]
MKICPTVPEELNRKLFELAPKMVLASQSPNRLLLLEEAGIEVTTAPQNVNENVSEKEPEIAVSHIALKKLESYISSEDFKEGVIALSCDTMVLFENKLLGKPHSKAEAREMLTLFSGREQKVLSGYSLYIPGKGIISGTDESTVYFEELTPEEIEDYLLTGDFIGAAGAYRIQRSGYKLIKKIEGSWTNVVGLPFERIIEHLSE